ncbi:hypothetical protein BJX96DRAFT_169464 [Aspergillus floccosus]
MQTVASVEHVQASIFSGAGFGTYYYDIDQAYSCHTNFTTQNNGTVKCSPTTGLSLNDINSNYLVAMNNTQLAADMDTYCGKRVVVSVEGKPLDLPLFIGDGCERCGTGSASDDVWDPNAAPGLDFSFSILSELSKSACANGHVSISWEIVDETLYNFDTKGLGVAQSPSTGGYSVCSTSPSASDMPSSRMASATAPGDIPCSTDR